MKMSEFHFDQAKIKRANGQTAAKPFICCQSCAQKAFFFATQVDSQGKATSKAYCLQHAFKAGLLHPRKWDLLDGAPMHKPAELTCGCGMTQSLLKNKGKVGCALCYTTFAAHLKPILPHVHNGGKVHGGKSPAKYAPRIEIRRRVKILELAMARAIKTEAYETAAVCRDQIKELVGCNRA